MTPRLTEKSIKLVSLCNKHCLKIDRQFREFACFGRARGPAALLAEERGEERHRREAPPGERRSEPIYDV